MGRIYTSRATDTVFVAALWVCRLHVALGDVPFGSRGFDVEELHVGAL